MVGLLRDSNSDDLPYLAAQFRDERPDPVIARFVAATVYVERDDSSNGLLAHEAADGTRWVHAYSRPDWLPGVDVGHDVDYASMTGQYLLALVPPDVGIRLDEGRPHAGDIRPALRPDAAPELVRAARGVHVGEGGRDRVLASLRSSLVYVGHPNDPAGRLPERQNWLCVFSALPLLEHELGSDCHHMQVSGHDLLDVLLRR